LLTDSFIRLGVNEDVIAEDACKIEHHSSKEIFETVKNMLLMNNGA